MSRRSKKQNAKDGLPPSHPQENFLQHRNFLMRSIRRNDVDLAALVKLNKSLKASKASIVESCGEAVLLDLGIGRLTLVNDELHEGIGNNSNNNDDENGVVQESSSQPQQHRLLTPVQKSMCVDFLLRMKLRRKLCNRLARRLNRIAHAMDGEDVAPPPPPRYGDLRLRIETDAVQAKVEHWELIEKAKKEIQKANQEIQMEIIETDTTRHREEVKKEANIDERATANTADIVKPGANDDIAQDPKQPTGGKATEKEDAAAADESKSQDATTGAEQKANEEGTREVKTESSCAPMVVEEKEPSPVTAPKTEAPPPADVVSSSSAANKNELKHPDYDDASLAKYYDIVKEYDTMYEKVWDPTSQTFKFICAEEPAEPEYTQLRGGNGIGGTQRPMSLPEREAEHKRWKTAILSRIPEQPTFEDLGMKNRVFCYEARKKRCLEIEGAEDEEGSQQQQENSKRIKLETELEAEAAEKKDDKVEGDQSEGKDTESASVPKTSSESEVNVKVEEKKNDDGSLDGVKTEDPASNDKEDGAKKEGDDSFMDTEETPKQASTGGEDEKMDIELKEASATEKKDAEVVCKKAVDGGEEESAEAKAGVAKSDDDTDEAPKASKPKDDLAELKTEETETANMDVEADSKEEKGEYGEGTNEEKKTDMGTDNDRSEIIGESVPKDEGDKRVSLKRSDDKSSDVIKASDEVEKSNEAKSDETKASPAQESPKKDVADKSGDSDKKKDSEKDKDLEEEKKPKKPMSLAPLPSFYEQDLARIRMIHGDLLSASVVEHNRRKYTEVMRDYKNALHVSADLHARRQKLAQNLSFFIAKSRNDIVKANNDYVIEVEGAKKRWIKQKHDYDVKRATAVMPSAWGQRPYGTNVLQTYIQRTQGTRASVASCLADVIDGAMLIAEGKVQNKKFGGFVPPPKPSTKDGKSLQQQQVDVENQLKRQLNEFNAKLTVSEEDRRRLWKKMMKTKTEMEGTQQTSGRRGRIDNERIPCPPLNNNQNYTVLREPSRSLAVPTYTPPVRPSQSPGTSDSKYSAARVRARHGNDGTVAPVSEPKKTQDGLYLRPAGRTRKGMQWDAIRGIWVPEGSQ